MSDRPLPTEAQRARLAELVQHAFVEIRAIAAQEGRGRQASDLADAFHNLPREVYGWGIWSPEITRGLLQSYQDKYHGEGYSPKYDYVAAFDRIFTV